MVIPVQAHAQTVQCSDQKIVGNDPRNNAKLVLCMPALRNDPAIVAIIDMLNRLNESNQRSAPRVQELVSSLANTGNLNAKQKSGDGRQYCQTTSTCPATVRCPGSTCN